MIDEIFTLSPDEALKYFEEKLPKKYDYDKIRFSAYNRTFLIKGINEIETLKRMHGILKKAYLNGTSFNDCVGELRNTSGLHKNHLRVVFNQNMRQVYSSARYEKQLSSDKPYLRYVSIMDSRVRASHRAFHGLILPKDDDFWRKNYPPNGWGCRCKVQALDDDEAASLGYTKGKKPPLAKLNPSERGFDNNPIEPNNALMKVLEDKLKTAPKELKKPIGRIINNAYKDAQKRETRYKELKAAYASAIQDFKYSGLDFTDFKKYIKEKTKKISKSDRDKLRITLATIGEKNVYIDKYQIASHLHHDEISPCDYSLIAEVIARGVKEKEEDNNIAYFTTILGRKYFLVLKELDDGFYVRSFRFEH